MCAGGERKVCIPVRNCVFLSLCNIEANYSWSEDYLLVLKKSAFQLKPVLCSFFLCKDETAKALKNWLKIQTHWELFSNGNTHLLSFKKIPSSKVNSSDVLTWESLVACLSSPQLLQAMHIISRSTFASPKIRVSQQQISPTTNALPGVAR